jgi:hypothetical protein
MATATRKTITPRPGIAGWKCPVLVFDRLPRVRLSQNAAYCVMRNQQFRVGRNDPSVYLRPLGAYPMPAHVMHSALGGPFPIFGYSLE